MRAARRVSPAADIVQPATGARCLRQRRRRQAPAVRPDGPANRGRPDHRDRRLPGSLAVRTMRPALRADVGALDRLGEPEPTVGLEPWLPEEALRELEG